MSCRDLQMGPFYCQIDLNNDSVTVGCNIFSFLPNPIENMGPRWTACCCVVRKGYDHLQNQRAEFEPLRLAAAALGQEGGAVGAVYPVGKNTCDWFYNVWQFGTKLAGDLETREKGIKHDNRIAIKIVLQRLVDNWRLPQTFKNQEMCFQFERLQFQVVFSIAHWKLVLGSLWPRSYHTPDGCFSCSRWVKWSKNGVADLHWKDCKIAAVPCFKTSSCHTANNPIADGLSQHCYSNKAFFKMQSIVRIQIVSWPGLLPQKCSCQKLSNEIWMRQRLRAHRAQLQ